MSRRSMFAFAALALVLAAALAGWLLRAPAVAAMTVQPAPLVRTLLFSARVATAVARRRGQHAHRPRARGAWWPKARRVRRATCWCGSRATSCAPRWTRPAPASARPRRGWPACAAPGRSAAQASVAQADSVLLAAQAELQRTQDLVARGFLSEARLDEARRAVAVAQAQHRRRQRAACRQRRAGHRRGAGAGAAGAGARRQRRRRGPGWSRPC